MQQPCVVVSLGKISSPIFRSPPGSSCKSSSASSFPLPSTEGSWLGMADAEGRPMLCAMHFREQARHLIFQNLFLNLISNFPQGYMLPLPGRRRRRRRRRLAPRPLHADRSLGRGGGQDGGRKVLDHGGEEEVQVACQARKGRRHLFSHIAIYPWVLFSKQRENFVTLHFASFLV